MRILFLQKRLLLPANTGGKIRSWNILKHLAKWHEITYLSNLLEHERPHVEQMRKAGLQMESIPWVEAPRKSLKFAGMVVANLFSKQPLNVDKDFDPRLRRRAEELIAQDDFDLLICDFVQMARNAIGLPLPSILFQHNVEAEVFARMAARSAGPMSWYLRYQAMKMSRFEQVAGKQFNRVIAVSDRDRQHFEQKYDWQNVAVIDTAVDLDYFSESERTESERTSTKNHIVFVGSMDWPPNVDGMRHFANAIWPKLKSAIPTAKLTIVGRNPPGSISRLDGNHDIEVTGTVSDTRPYLNRASVGIVPLYSGGGTRLKIFEMMAMGCAVVSTQLGAEGLGVESGQDLMIADQDDVFAQSIAKLLKTNEFRETMVRRARKLVQSKFSAPVIAAQFNKICLDTVDASKSSS